MLSKKEAFSSWHAPLTHIGGDNAASENVEWNYIIESHNVTNGSFVYHVKNGRNIILGWTINGNENMYDAFTAGSPNWNDYYGVFWVWTGDNVYISCHIVSSSNIYYSYLLESCSFCLGCVWLKNKSYCILNKQYTKEEWHELADKIFAQMDTDGILWDFFPWYLNPFYFNDTVAYLIDDSFTKDEVWTDGYMWRNEEIQVDIPNNTEVVETKDLHNFQWFDPNGIWKIDPEILKKIIKDDKWNIYRVVKMEYDFLAKHSLPLPETHWLDRIKLWFHFK